MSIVRALGRRLRSMAALGIAGLGLLTQQACTFNLTDSRSTAGDLYRRYEESMENRAQRRLRDYDSVVNKVRQSREDPFLYDAMMRDGLPGMLGDDAETGNIERGQKEVLGVVRRAAGDTLKDAFRGKLGGVSDYVIPDLDGEEQKPLIGAYGPEEFSPAPAPERRERRGKDFRIKAMPGLHRVVYGVRVGPLEVKGAKRYTDKGNTLKSDFKLDDFILDGLYVNGGFDRDFDKDKRTLKLGVQYGAFSGGVHYTVDGREEEKNERRETQLLVHFHTQF